MVHAFGLGSPPTVVADAAAPGGRGRAVARRAPGDSAGSTAGALPRRPGPWYRTPRPPRPDRLRESAGRVATSIPPAVRRSRPPLDPMDVSQAVYGIPLDGRLIIVTAGGFDTASRLCEAVWAFDSS